MNCEYLILRSLDRCGTCMLPEDSLQVEINIAAPGPVTRTELRAALGKLERLGHLVSVRDEISESVVRWKITDNGKAKLREYGL